jgi:hypothetical protein
MDNKEIESKEMDQKELNLDEMDKVSGGMVLIDGRPPKEFSREDLIKLGLYHPKVED